MSVNNTKISARILDRLESKEPGKLRAAAQGIDAIREARLCIGIQGQEAGGNEHYWESTEYTLKHGR
jgi:hypothetical protein